jgi:hypothetical protein
MIGRIAPETLGHRKTAEPLGPETCRHKQQRSLTIVYLPSLQGQGFDGIEIAISSVKNLLSPTVFVGIPTTKLPAFSGSASAKRENCISR